MAPIVRMGQIVELAQLIDECARLEGRPLTMVEQTTIELLAVQFDALEPLAIAAREAASQARAAREVGEYRASRTRRMHAELGLSP